MNRRTFLAATAASGVALLRAQPIQRPQRDYVIICDDWAILNPIDTPALYAFAAKGTLFTNFNAAPLCCNARAEFATGAISLHNYCGENVPPTDSFAGPVGSWICDGIQSAHHGKVHMIGSPWVSVMRSRWSTVTGVHANLDQDGSYSYVHWQRLDASGSIATETHYATDSQLLDAEASCVQGVPLVVCAISDIHKPLDCPPPGYSGFGTFAMHLAYMDQRVAASALFALSLGYRVWICGDNGTSGAGKGTFTNDGTNTPLIVAGPGVPVGVTRSDVVMLTDLYPTIRNTTTPDGMPIDFSGSSVRSFGCMSSHAGLGAPVIGSRVRCVVEPMLRLVSTDIDASGAQSEAWYSEITGQQVNPVRIPTADLIRMRSELPV